MDGIKFNQCSNGYSNTATATTRPTGTIRLSNNRSNRDLSAFSTYPGDFRTGRDQTPRRFGGRGGSRRLDY
jgi:hypothetical protein